MNLSELVIEINSLADENEPVQDVVAWINDAIARMNIELGAKFSFMSVEDMEAEPEFPEIWQRGCLIPFGVGRIKQMDSSQFEYNDAYAEFMANLTLMKTKYNVPEELRDENIKNESFTIDLSKSMYAGIWY